MEHTPDPTLAFGEALQRRKFELDLTFAELAGRLGHRHAPNVIRVHQGDSFPKEDKLPNYVRAYEIPLEVLQPIYDKTKAARQEDSRNRQSLHRKRVSRYVPGEQAGVESVRSIRFHNRHLGGVYGRRG